MTKKKIVKKTSPVVKKKRPPVKKKFKVRRGRPKGSVNKTRRKTSNRQVFVLPIGEKFTDQHMLDLVRYINKHKKKNLAGAATDGTTWWLAFV